MQKPCFYEVEQLYLPCRYISCANAFISSLVMDFDFGDHKDVDNKEHLKKMLKWRGKI